MYENMIYKSVTNENHAVGEESFELELIQASKTAPVFRDVCLTGSMQLLSPAMWSPLYSKLKSLELLLLIRSL